MEKIESFTYKMAAKVNWHRCGTKLRHCHPMCIYGIHTSRAMKRSDAAFHRAAYFQIPVAIGEEIFPLKFTTQVCGIFLSMTGIDSIRRDNTLILIHSYRLVSNYHE